MGRFIRTTLALSTLAVLLAGAAWAQGAVTTRISGQVVGTDGAGLPGVTVTFASPNLQGSRVVITEVGGNYASPPLPPGVYTVTFELAGFQPVAQQVRGSATATVPLNVTLEQVDIREEITVTGEAI
ncbi:MAG: carboxypeptidase-like regulatory domain-containing protein, partial [Thermoanaerobaculia bacterium]